jgi:hypothetical protein
MALSKRQKHMNRMNQLRRIARSNMQVSSNQEDPAATHDENPARSVPESGSEAVTSRKEKRKLDTTEYNDPIDLSAKHQVVSQYPSASMSQILHTLPRLPTNFDDGDVDSEASDDSDDSDGSDDFGEFLDDSDVGDEAETSPDNAGGVKTAILEWHPSAGKSLRGSYGSGSRATIYREKQRQDSLQREASKSYSIVGLFERQAARNRQTMDEAHNVALSEIGHGKSTGPTAEEARSKASSDLKRLVELPTEQSKKYGYVLSKNSDFFKRHIMLLSFLWIRQKRENFPGVKLRELARMVATNHNKGTGYARNLVVWERSWTENRIIPQRQSRKSPASVSWMNEEDIACAARDFVKTQGDGKLPFSSSCEAISLTFIRNNLVQACPVRFRIRSGAPKGSNGGHRRDQRPRELDCLGKRDR